MRLTERWRQDRTSRQMPPDAPFCSAAGEMRVLWINRLRTNAGVTPKQKAGPLGTGLNARRWFERERSVAKCDGARKAFRHGDQRGIDEGVGRDDLRSAFEIGGGGCSPHVLE